MGAPKEHLRAATLAPQHVVVWPSAHAIVHAEPLVSMVTRVPLAKERATSPPLPPVGAAGPSGAPRGRAKSALQPWPLHHVGNTGAVGLPPSQHSRHGSSVLFAEEKAKLRRAEGQGGEEEGVKG